jgi:hypothetical protein
MSCSPSCARESGRARRPRAAARTFVEDHDAVRGGLPPPGGNSGSPVFSDRTYKLEGLLVRGQTDFVSTGSCNVSMVFPTSGPVGEDVTRATEWAGKIPKSAAHRPGKGKRREATLTRPRR